MEVTARSVYARALGISPKVPIHLGNVLCSCDTKKLVDDHEGPLPWQV